MVPSSIRFQLPHETIMTLVSNGNNTFIWYKSESVLTCDHCPSMICSFMSLVGVDIGRFAQDPEYKRETILGLAM